VVRSASRSVVIGLNSSVVALRDLFYGWKSCKHVYADAGGC